VTDTSKPTRPGRRLAPVALALVTGLGIVACTTPDPGTPGPTTPTTPTTAKPAQCHPGPYDTATLSGTTLRVTGTLPSMSQTVKLEPVTYIQQPEFWQINVTVCDPAGAGLPATKPFDITLDVSSTLGKQGIVVVGANQKTQLPLDARPAVVGPWRVTGVSGGITGGVIPVVAGTSISLTFERNGKVSGTACNSYFGEWDTKDGFHITGIGSTKKACTEPPGAMAQEQRYFAALALTRNVEVTGNQLALLDEGGKEIVTAVRGATGPGPR
jgi:hypothetical protein